MKEVIQGILKDANTHRVQAFINKMYEFGKQSTTSEVSMFLRQAMREAGEVLNTLKPVVIEIKIKEPSDVKMGDVITVMDSNAEIEVIVVDHPFEHEGRWVCRVVREFSPESFAVVWNEENSTWENSL